MKISVDHAFVEDQQGNKLKRSVHLHFDDMMIRIRRKDAYKLLEALKTALCDE